MSRWDIASVENILADYNAVVMGYGRQQNKNSLKNQKRKEDRKGMKNPREILQDIYNTYADGLKKRVEQEDLFYVVKKSAESFKSNDELLVLENKAKYLKAEKEYKEKLENMAKETQEKIKELVADYNNAVDKYYVAKPESINTNQLELLKSGILTEKELKMMAEENENNNPTMYRIVAKYCEGIDSPNMRYIANQGQTMDGRFERTVLEDLTAEWGERIFSDDKNRHRLCGSPEFLDIGQSMVNHLNEIDYGYSSESKEE